MLKDITFGQYYEGRSVIHKTDPRVKIILMILFIVFVFLAKNTFALIFAGVSVLAVMLISRVPLRLYLKNIKAILPVLIFTAIINVFYGEGETLIRLWKLTITTGGVYRALFMAARIIMLIFISGALTYTTTPIALTDAIEQLFSFLSLFHVPVHDFAMILSIALRFIPSIIEETETIMAAQKSRGADYEGGGLIRRTKALIPVIIPLFASQFRRAYDLAVAMICRCYRGGKGKTRLRVLKFRFSDYLMLVLMVAFGAGFELCNIFLGHIGYLMK